MRRLQSVFLPLLSRMLTQSFLRLNSSEFPKNISRNIDRTEASDSSSSGAASDLQDAQNTPNPASWSDDGPLQPTGMWSSQELVDESQRTVSFARMDNIESEIFENLEGRDRALVSVEDEERWKQRLMFEYKFKKTPKHLTWKELGQEIDCVECVIDLDEYRPEERFTIRFFFMNRRTGRRDEIWWARNDVSYSEGFTDLLAAIGSCLSRADVFRTIRFDDGHGTMRDLTLQKRSKMTSDITISFRPPIYYNMYDRKEDLERREKEAAAAGASLWGFHPRLMDPEYRDDSCPPGTYRLAISAHAFSFVMMRCIERLTTKPMHKYYRPSQVSRKAKVKGREYVGLSDAMKGWLGIDEATYTHYTPIEALQDHWLGEDAPFTLVAIINKLREATYLKKRNPEFYSWLSVRRHQTARALRNTRIKFLGAGASPLLLPPTHNIASNLLLPKSEQKTFKVSFSLNALLGMPDETRKISSFKKITESQKTISPQNGDGKK